MTATMVQWICIIFGFVWLLVFIYTRDSSDLVSANVFFASSLIIGATKSKDE